MRILSELLKKSLEIKMVLVFRIMPMPLINTVRYSFKN